MKQGGICFFFEEVEKVWKVETAMFFAWASGLARPYTWHIVHLKNVKFDLVKYRL